MHGRFEKYVNAGNNSYKNIHSPMGTDGCRHSHSSLLIADGMPLSGFVLELPWNGFAHNRLLRKYLWNLQIFFQMWCWNGIHTRSAQDHIPFWQIFAFRVSSQVSQNELCCFYTVFQTIYYIVVTICRFVKATITRRHFP